MKTIDQLTGIAFLFVCFFASCEKNDVYSIPTPVVESANVNPSVFSFGDEVTLAAQLSDKDARLSQLIVNIIAGERVIGRQVFPLSGNTEEVNTSLFIPLVDNQADGAAVKIELILRNVLKGEATHEITGLTGKRSYYDQLYLVTDDGKVLTLAPKSGNKDHYEASGLELNRSFSYKIAQKLTIDHQIDYSGLAWGSVNGKIALIDDKGESLFAFVPESDYTKNFTFDNYAFSVTLTGAKLGPNDLALNDFNNTTFDGELFRFLTRSLTKGQELNLFGDLADDMIVYNPDFFERLAGNRVKFLGETGEYTLYYNTYRRHVIAGVNNPAYPDYLLMTGNGLGYPTKVSGIDREHTSWGFGNVRNYILFRQTAENIYQGTMFIKDASWAGFKPYETTGWGGEKQYNLFAFTGEKVLESSDGNDWHSAADIDADAFYRLVINWAENTVHVEKITF
ncbi:MAG: hypothetical protein LBH19_05680 [Dysgonamonadaceae bacterium]|jgi:hypothetical protein|nr:hypothetical protein [Dysgonamonadaceae bacterium]